MVPEGAVLGVMALGEIALGRRVPRLPLSGRKVSSLTSDCSVPPLTTVTTSLSWFS